MTKVVLITGGAKRIGRAISQFLHQKGMLVAIHCHTSMHEAQELAARFNAKRENSSIVVQGNLKVVEQHANFIGAVLKQWGRLDVVINNASVFFATPFATASCEDFNDLLDTNLKAPFFLAQAAIKPLQAVCGCIINISDIHAQKPLKFHSIYCMAKAGIKMMTESLSRELAPNIRVNCVSPGAILWPEKDVDSLLREKIIQRIPLKRQGKPLDIAKAVWFLINADYMTGQTVVVDGGRLLD